jgi:hypothetical protein
MCLKAYRADRLPRCRWLGGRRGTRAGQIWARLGGQRSAVPYPGVLGLREVFR